MKKDYFQMIWLLLPILSSCTNSGKQSDSQPNIIFVLTDDQRWDSLGYAGNKYISTPNLDRLASKGVYFPNTYTTTSISAVSRATILTGQHVLSHKIHDFSKGLTAEQLEDSYPIQLQKSGYYIGLVGKYGVGYKDIPSDRFDYWRGLKGSGTYWDDNVIGKGEHLTNIQGDDIQEFIKTRDREKPFCLSVGFSAAHGQDSERKKGGEEFPSAKEEYHLYNDVEIPLSKTRNDYGKLHESFCYNSEKKKENESRLRWKYRFKTDSLAQKTVKNYYRLVSGVDRQIGLMMKTLEAEGLSENTVIIFISDNGFYLGEHGLAGKWYSHEESIRLPCFIYDPRFSRSVRGKKIEDIVLNMDMAPTILSIAGLPIPESMQGKNLYSLIDGNAKQWREQFYYLHDFNSAGFHIPCNEAIVVPPYKLTHYYDKHEDSEEWYEVYDVLKDPYEEHNLIGEENYQDLIKN